MTLIRPATFLIAILAFQGFAQTPAQKPPDYLRQATVTEVKEVVHITANSPRPLQQTLDALQQKYGWIVGYEDPRYISHLDTVDVTANGSQSELPAGGEFNVEFPASAPDQETTLKLVVETYDRSKNPGKFELRHADEGTFYVVGTAAHNEAGAIAAQGPVFDLLVTIPSQERTVDESLEMICHAVEAQAHTAIILGVEPTTILQGTTAKIGGTKVSARDLLLQCLKATHRNLYWRLLFDATAKRYFLDIHSVRQPEKKPHA
jgi:hypothetical protein